MPQPFVDRLGLRHEKQHAPVARMIKHTPRCCGHMLAQHASVLNFRPLI